jgi:vacuolar-type H+-ATPase subunit F/Vma7
VAIDEEYLAALDEDSRNRVRDGYRPLVIGIPSGRRVSPEERRSLDIAELIRRAIGFRLVLGEEMEEDEAQ